MALLTLVLVASTFAHGSALLSGKSLESNAATGSAIDEAGVIPDEKLDLIAEDGKDWWTRFGNYVSTSVSFALWGVNQPAITSSPAQNRQRCPVLKLPENFNAAAKQSYWTSLYGEWNTPNNVNLATWEQSYLGMGFSRNIANMGVHIRAASTGQVAIRTRLFTDEEMSTLFDWKVRAAAATKGANASTAAAGKETDSNLALFDCVGALMYVVKQTSIFPKMINLYSRDGSLVAKSTVGRPILRYQFVDAKKGYLIATAEAPGINASIKSDDIPAEVAVGGVLPFGFHFEQGGFANSSGLMDTEYRWVLAATTQALAIYNAQEAETPWNIITTVETIIITLMVLSVLAVGVVLFCTYRCVYPGGYSAASKSDNLFMATPMCPPPRNTVDAAKAYGSMQYAHTVSGY